MPNALRFASRTRLLTGLSFVAILLFLAASVLISPSSALTNNGSITTLGSPLTENFDTLASAGTGIAWADNSTIPGWYSSRATYNSGTGSSNTGALYSFGVLGTNPASDRALGSVGSGGTGIVYWGAKLVNNTGSTITSIDLSYIGEQWRTGGSSTATPSIAQTADFQYQVANAGVITGINTPSTGWNDHDALDFTSPVFGTTGGSALDGNAAANRVARASTVPVTINSGQEIWLRWRDIDHPNNDHGLAVDQLSVTANGSGNPTGVGAANPNSVPPGGTTLLTVAVTPGTNPASVTHTVAADLTAIGGSNNQTLFDDGSNGDATPNDNTFSYNATVANGTTGGLKNLPVIITETSPQSRIGNASISLTVLTPTNPSGVGAANPNTVVAGGTTLLTVAVTPGANPTSTGLTVVGDLSPIGGSATQSFFDNATNGDVTAGDNTFSFSATVAEGTSLGAKILPIQISDDYPRTANTSISLTVEAPPPANDVVISQIYGGGGNTGADLKNDYIELINHSGSPVILNGWSVQAFVTPPGGGPGSWQITPLPDVTLEPGQYFLIQEAAGEGGIDDLPEPDAFGTIPVSSSSTKVALLNNTTLITTTCPSAGSAGIVDLVGYGSTDCFEGSAAPTLSNTTALLRMNNGCFDTNNNARDFAVGNPNPRNSSSPTNDCTGLSGIGSANPFSVVVGASTTLTVHVAPAQDPTSTGIAVTADLSQIGGSATQVFSGGPTTFTFAATVPENNPTGLKSLPVTIQDAQTRVGTTNIFVKVIPVIPDHVTISQIYGGGGNSGATYSHDYVELYNPHTDPFDLTGWSLQYASASGESWQVQPLGGSVAPGEYYLISLGTQNSTIGGPLPPANVNGDINMAGGAGKIALVNNFDALAGPCPISDLGIVDFLGYGTTATCAETTRTGLVAPNNTTALFRKSGGAVDTDNNSADFETGRPNPRRTAPIVELGPSVFATDPRNGATTAPRDATIVISFTEPVNVDDDWYTINCVSGNHDDATVRSFFGKDTYTITPNVNFLAGEQCTVTIYKDKIHDVDDDDTGTNADSLPADKVFTFTVATGTAPPADANNLLMGNPTAADLGQPDNYLMEKPEFSLSYNRTRGTANWVSWHLSDDWIGTLARVDTFRADPAVPADWFRVSGFDYASSGFDRGHMVPNADRDRQTSVPINQATFLMTNMLPQAPDNNQGPWANLEGFLRTLLPGNEIYIVAGGAGTGGTIGTVAEPVVVNTIAGGKVTVPSHTWKVALILPKASGDDVARVDCSTRTLAVIMPNTQGIRNVDWQTYITTVDAVENLTGYDLFSNLPDAVENCVEAGTNGANSPATANQSASTQEDTGVEITLHAVRPNTNPLTFSIVSEPTNGELGSIGSPSCTDHACSATVTYTPGSNYHGPDSFTFKVNDGTVDSNTSTVSITVNSVNDDPDAVDDEATVVEDSGANTIDVRANDSDVENHVLTVTAVTQGSNGSVAITNGGADVSYTPNADFFGADSFTYTVSDGNGGDDTATVSITVTNVNDAPVLTSSVAMSLISSTNSNLFNVGLSATAADADGEVVTIQVAVFGDEDDETATLPGVVHSPDAKDIAPNTLRLRGERVEANDGRVYLIIVTATDASGGVDRNYHTVVVPKNNKPANVNEVIAEGAAAAAFAESNGGTPPPGYFVIGDGPIMGPKQ